MQPKRDLFSFSGRLALVAATALALGLGALLDHQHAWLVALVALLFGVPLAVLGAHAVALPLTRFLGALTDGLTSLRDGDFSLSLARPRGLPESAELAD